MLNLETYPISAKTDRDVELPNFLDFLEKVRDKIESALDVGCQFTAHYYAHELRKAVKIYHGLDPLPDKEVKKIVDQYYQVDAVGWEFAFYDLVVCLSTLEHIGQYPVKYRDYKEKRFSVFEKMLAAAEKYFWLSVPVGQAHLCLGEMAIFDQEEFKRYEEKMKPFKTAYGYFWSEGPQSGAPWTKSNYDKVFGEPYIDSLGNRGICIVEVEK